MEIAESDEKFAAIRQTIRRVILPLVQSIYEVDPPDIELFCSQFFASELRKRESKEKDAVDGNLISTEDVPEEREVGKYIQKTEDRIEKITSSTTNIQGSASDPVLTSEKCHGVSLRETSSWDITPNHSKIDRGRADLISSLSDAKCGVGDQPCHEITTSIGDPDINRKAGDEYSLSKREDKIIEHENIAPSGETGHVSDVLPSAPPYDGHSPKLENIKTELENSDPEIEILLEKNNSTLKEKGTNKVSYPVPDGAESSYSDKHSDAGGIKICSAKVLSPNSSFGFIPHLNETRIKEESPDFTARSKSSKDSDFKEGSIAEVPGIASKFSDTLQNIALKFDSAETNLDVEFEKAKEISDLMHGRSLEGDFKDEGKFNFNSPKDDESLSEKKCYKSSSVKMDSYIDVEEISDINSVKNTNENNHQIQEKSSISSHVLGTKGEFETGRHENKSESSKTQSRSSEADIKKEGPELHQMKRNSFIQQKNLNDDKNRSNSSASIDEEWRKRWYEAHPCLDNSSNRLRQTQPRMQMGTQVYVGAHAYPVVNPIGEAGDVPPDLFRHTPQNNSNRNLRNLESNNREERNISFSPILEEHHAQEKCPTDEIQRGENTKLTFNNLDKNTTRIKASNSCSSNVPWRKMSDHQARYLETEKQVLKQLQESCGEGAISKEMKSKGNSKASRTQALQNSLSEIVVEKQTSKNNYDYEINNKNDTIHNTEREEKIFKHKFKDNTHQKLQSSPFVKNDLFKADKPEDVKKIVSNIENKSITNFNALDDTLKRKPKPCHEGNRKAVFENQTNPEEDKYKDFDSYSTRDEYKTHRNDVANRVDGSENVSLRLSSNEDLISEVKDKIQAYQRMDNSPKIEPGLDSAGGDFSSPNINETDDQLGCPDYNNTSPSHQEVTAEYVEEIIERVIQQDSLSDSYEGLNFSSLSDIDSSDMESEYSDAEDSNLCTEVCEP